MLLKEGTFKTGGPLGAPGFLNDEHHCRHNDRLDQTGTLLETQKRNAIDAPNQITQFSDTLTRNKNIKTNKNMYPTAPAGPLVDIRLTRDKPVAITQTRLTELSNYMEPGLLQPPPTLLCKLGITPDQIPIVF